MRPSNPAIASNIKPMQTEMGIKAMNNRSDLVAILLCCASAGNSHTNKIPRVLRYAFNDYYIYFDFVFGCVMGRSQSSMH